MRVYLVYAFIFTSIVDCKDLYDVLGVDKSASTQEIKTAYKKLAREWHPDKNDDPSAADKFTKINEAYETLGSKDKRAAYDNFGHTAGYQEPRGRPFHHPGFSPFDDFFAGGGGFKFNFGGGGESSLGKYTITLRKYESIIVPESHQKPCFIYVYSDFCFNCMRVEPLIEKILVELENIGMCVGTFHARDSASLTSHLRIHQVPTILAVVNGRPTYYNDHVSMQILRNFVRKLFPKNTLTEITDSNYEKFLMGWTDNRVRGIFFGQKEEPSARFLAPAYQYRERVAFGYIPTHSNKAIILMNKFNINRNRDSLLLFNEDISSPVATASMQQMSRKTIDELIDRNLYLQLPRLSSQPIFEKLCPEEPRRKNRQFCVVLITEKKAEYDNHRTLFRNFATASKFPPQRVKFTYMYKDTQDRFISTLTRGNKTRSNNILEVAIIWRMDTRKLNYEFLEAGWNIDENSIGLSRKSLENRLHELLSNEHFLPYKAVIPEVYNEHTLDLLTRIVYKIIDWSERLYWFLCGYDTMTWTSVLLTLFFIALMGFVMHKLTNIEAEQVKKKMAESKRNVQKRPPSSSADNQTIHIYELRYDTYSNLVKEADTGLTFIICANEEFKKTLLWKFAEIMQPYSRYSALTFGFLQLEYYISWYQSLLETSMDNKVKLNKIKINNCVGTVLAINGYRKYYYLYHPKKTRKFLRKENNVGQAMGLLDSDDESTEDERQIDIESHDQKVMCVREMLDGLTIWMDRVFDGSIRKVRLNEWPEMTY
ncbi:hypothetical protein SNE40_014098 [Patella caerulea]|uniref:J domain-containing protein n=1 Tax=Patella caerulea TaxID=87958 RepID=A0AAN8JD89_PATCE